MKSRRIFPKIESGLKQVDGHLTAIEPIHQNDVKKRWTWKCQCECGNMIEIFGTLFTTGRVRTCRTKGCKYYSELLGQARTTHGAVKKGKATKEYSAWSHIKDRCLNKNSKLYKYYGGRGITVCDQWINSFECFLKDVGLAPDDMLTIERIDNNSGYFPGNCRWATMKEQGRNRRDNLSIEYYGEFLTLAEIAERENISTNKLYRHYTVHEKDIYQSVIDSKLSWRKKDAYFKQVDISKLK